MLREAIQELLDLSNVPTWRELADGTACALAIIVLTAVLYLCGVAMGAHP